MKKQVKSVLSVVLVICTLLVNLSMAGTAFAATPKGVVTKVQNLTSSIKVTWSRDTTKTGYYIFRKTGNGSYVQVKKITKNSTLTWEDTNVKNGVRYSYQVKSYKGTKKTSNSVTKSIYRLSKPSISSIENSGVGCVRIVGSSNNSASGFEVKYSRSKDFSNAKILKFGGTKKLDKNITGLTSNVTYYFKIRAYYQRSTGNDYSVYSSYKTIKTTGSCTAYTSHIRTTIYAKPDSSSTKTILQYMTKVTLKGIYSKSSKGTWQKLAYNGKDYYVWIEAGESKFTKTKNPYTYTDENNTKYQQEVIDYAVYIFKNWDTAYVKNKDGSSSNGIPNSKGVYGFDCSGFVSYVINTTMEKYVPVYALSQHIEKIGLTESIYNPNHSTELKAKTVCKGKLDYTKMQPGDIIFWDLDGGEHKYDWNHCGIYLGKKQFIHSTASLGGVGITPLESEYVRDFVKVVRVLPTKVSPMNLETKTKAKYTTIYSEKNAKENYKIDSLKLGTPITVLYVGGDKQYAYVKYGDNKKGYVYKPYDKLNM